MDFLTFRSNALQGMALIKSKNKQYVQILRDTLKQNIKDIIRVWFK